MTHQDVVVVIAELRAQARNRATKCGAGSEIATVEWRAADLIESQANDIAVKESAIAECARTIHKLMTRALAAESRLAEARRVIEPFANAIADDGTFIGLARSRDYRAARDFLNAKEKT